MSKPKGAAKYLGPFQIVDEVEEVRGTKSKEETALRVEVKTEKIELQTEKGETNCSTQQDSQEAKNNCQEEQKADDEKNKDCANTENREETDKIICKSEVLEDDYINKTGINESCEGATIQEAPLSVPQEVAKSVEPPEIEVEEPETNTFQDHEEKEDSINLSHEEERSIKSCQDNDTHGESATEDCNEDEDDEREGPRSHPYLFMIENYELTPEQKTTTHISPPKSIKDTPVHIIQTRAELIKLLHVLNTVKEIALNARVDTSHFASKMLLLELSTREADYIIDARKLNRELLLLTEIFINPKIIKIMYGSRRVMCILQRVYLYPVNIFDIESANVVLEGGHKPLEAILQSQYSLKVENKYFGGQTKLNLQLNREYYRVYTHYLIYVYHDYKNKLLAKNLFKDVVDQCREACKIIYPDFRAVLLQAMEEELKNRHKCEIEVLEKLNKWRNATAKKENKDPNDIIQTPHIIAIASTLPYSEISLCNFSESNYYLRLNAANILAMIKESRDKYSVKYNPLVLKQHRSGSKNYRMFLINEISLYSEDAKKGQLAKRKANDIFAGPSNKRSRPGPKLKIPLKNFNNANKQINVLSSPKIKKFNVDTN